MAKDNQTTESVLITGTLNPSTISKRWRENFLNIVIRLTVLFGTVMFAFTFPHGDYRVLSIFAIILLLLLVVSFARFSFAIRAGVFSGLIYLVGTITLLEYGISADASTFLLAFITITSLLFDHRVGFGALALSIASMIFVVGLKVGGLLSLLVITNLDIVSKWVIYGLDMSVLGIVILLAVYFLKREFYTVLYHEKEKFNTLQRERIELEARVAERTADLKKANQKNEEQASRLRIVAEVSRTAAAIAEPGRLMPILANLISEQLGFYHIGIFLLDDAREYAILSASNSEGGRRMLERGHRLHVGQQGIVGYVTDSGQPRIASNVGADLVFFDNPDLPETRSEMCLPLKVNEVTIGALDIQSTIANAFTEEDSSLLTILADQVAIAIQNAKANEETKRALQEAEVASSQLTGHAWKKYSSEHEIKGYSFRGLKAEPIEGNTNSLDETDAIRVPIRLRGQVIGNLKLAHSDEASPWTDDELALTRATAERVALALESARLLEDSQRRASKERIIGEVTAKISQSINLQNILQTAVEELGRVIPGSDIVIQFQSDSDKRKQEK
jgi:GAF domain-containing protein